MLSPSSSPAGGAKYKKAAAMQLSYTRKKNIDNVPTNNQLSNSQYSSLKTATVAAAEHRCRF